MLERVVDDVLSKVPELANNSDEARHSHARQQSLGVVFACRSVQLWIGKSQLIPKFISNQRHFSNTLDSSSFLNSSHPPKPSLNAFRLVHSSALLFHQKHRFSRVGFVSFFFFFSGGAFVSHCLKINDGRG
jgi:hypothetical protein